MRAWLELAREALAELRAVREAVERLADREAGAEADRPEGPVYVAEAARILGMSRSTLDRKIAECPPEKRPAHLGGEQRRRWFWPSTAAVVEWAEQLNEPAVKSRPQRAPRVVTGGAVKDWAAVARAAGAARRDPA